MLITPERTVYTPPRYVARIDPDVQFDIPQASASPAVTYADALTMLKRDEISSDELMSASPIYWAWLAELKIKHPVFGVIPFDLYPHQVRFLADKAKDRLVVKSRQIGFSQVCALEALHTALFQEGSTILFISRKEELAANLLAYVRNIWDSVPDYQRPKLVTDNKLELAWSNGSRIKSESASESAGAGFAGTALYLDEAARMPFARTIYQAAAPTVSLGGRMTIFSSPLGRVGLGGFFYELFATSQGNNFSKHRVPWYRCPAFNPEGHSLPKARDSKLVGMAGVWYKTERPKYTEKEWATEFDCDFSKSGTAVFKDEFIDAMADGWWGLMPPVPGRTYLTAIDIGRRADPFVAFTGDITDFERYDPVRDAGLPRPPVQIVHYEYHQGLPYPDQIELIHDIYDTYEGWIYIESNGPGDAVLDMTDRRWIEGYHVTPIKKRQMIDAFMYAQENYLFKCGIEALLLECKKYEEDDKELVQDHVMTGGLLSRQLVSPGAIGGWILGNNVSPR